MMAILAASQQQFDRSPVRASRPTCGTVLLIGLLFSVATPAYGGSLLRGLPSADSGLSNIPGADLEADLVDPDDLLSESARPSGSGSLKFRKAPAAENEARTPGLRVKEALVMHNKRKAPKPSGWLRLFDRGVDDDAPEPEATPKVNVLSRRARAEL
eukprot:gnl/TRDRNA2_/TRDRNA2_165100_c0_seq4.p1 gnl/TRDRNA2_/TRDRNA2_165100_c0~~gnl/TRDRNA2_/TRDRNA2_165100_c0_seq4.p1  ORF type:complete len:181 (+),score=29.88 gnl/TRDRNA2_/TRDRNA2_165100_c0_seq4:75-545(+)